MNIQHHIKISYMYECARGGKIGSEQKLVSYNLVDFHLVHVSLWPLIKNTLNFTSTVI